MKIRFNMKRSSVQIPPSIICISLAPSFFRLDKQKLFLPLSPPLRIEIVCNIEKLLEKIFETCTRSRPISWPLSEYRDRISLHLCIDFKKVPIWEFIGITLFHSAEQFIFVICSIGREIVFLRALYSKTFPSTFKNL